MLDAKTREKIENGFKAKTRLKKKRMFREIGRCFEICDACPINGQAVSDAAPEEPNSYESICGMCPIYKRLRNVGTELWEKDTNIEYLLSKGEELTPSEVLYLLERGATKKSIQRALGFTNPKQLNGFLDTIIKAGDGNRNGSYKYLDEFDKAEEVAKKKKASIWSVAGYVTDKGLAMSVKQSKGAETKWI